MQKQDDLFGLLKTFSDAASYEVAADGRSVTINAPDGEQVTVLATTFKNMAKVNDALASNHKKENPYAPISADRARYLKPVFADALAEIRQAEWRARVSRAIVNDNGDNFEHARL